MRIESVCILGGTGFVGRAIADQLASRGIRVRVATRRETRAAPLLVLPTVEVAEADIHRVGDLEALFENMDAVINLVGILHETRGQTFRQCHEELPAKVVRACHHAGVQHLLHMSALRASVDGPSEYLRSKGRGEARLREQAGVLPWTIFRPSVIFGRDDRFLNTFAALVRAFPIIPLAGARARFQPIWVEDVARCFAQALGDRRAAGQVFELAGPDTYTLEELVRWVGETLGRRPRIARLPGGLARLQAAVFERLPGKLITRDNLRSMSVDNVSEAPFPALFGFEPSPLEAVMRQHLAHETPRARYAGFRRRA